MSSLNMFSVKKLEMLQGTILIVQLRFKLRFLGLHVFFYVFQEVFFWQFYGGNLEVLYSYCPLYSQFNVAE